MLHGIFEKVRFLFQVFLRLSSSNNRVSCFKIRQNDNRNDSLGPVPMEEVSEYYSCGSASNNDEATETPPPFADFCVTFVCLDRIYQQGTESIMGVPGDMNLELLDYVKEVPGLKWGTSGRGFPTSIISVNMNACVG